MSGTSVHEGFTLPWNTTRTMSDVLAEYDAKAEQRRAQSVEREKKLRLERQRQFVAEYQRRANLPPVTAAGKLAYAGYDGEEV